MDFDLNTYSAQKALYDEASSFDHFFDDMFEDCDDLDNIISEEMWYYSIISALLTEPQGIELWEALILIPGPIYLS